jgi:antitoxin component of RelBE/YafQ-DinJ toxin-antitoxin module
MKAAVDERSTLKRLKLIPILFRKQDAEKVTPHAAIFLSRALKQGLVHRLYRGNYVNSFLHGFPRVEEVACFVRPPAYVTGEWALNYHGVSAQSPVVCTAVTLGSAVGSHHRVRYQGVTIEFSKISPSLFFGFNRIDNFYMATPEKAILDTFYLRRALPTPDELEMETINIETLQQMARRFPLTVWKGIAKAGLPFELQMPNARTMKAIRNSREGKGKRSSTSRELFKAAGI